MSKLIPRATLVAAAFCLTLITGCGCLTIDPDRTGRGVPVSAVITDGPQVSPYKFHVHLDPGLSTKIELHIRRVESQGATRPRWWVKASAPAPAGENEEKVEMQLSMSPEAPPGTYRITFRCCNGDSVTAMKWHVQELTVVGKQEDKPTVIDPPPLQ